MRTRIISAFPGIGKTYYHNEHPHLTLDSDSSNFSWIVKDGQKIRNPNFPDNYIEHIKKNIGKYEFIFVSSHKEIREALICNCLFFYLVYSPYDNKNEFIKRYKERGSSDIFIKLIFDNWDKWIKECHTEQCCKKIVEYDNLETTIYTIMYDEEINNEKTYSQ